VANTGSRAGAAVAQLYVSDGLVTLPLDARSFSYFDGKTSQWRAEAGTFKILVGSSSEQIERSTELKLERTIVTAP